MAKSKKKIIESLAAVKNVGPKYAEAAYDELGIRSVGDLVTAAEKGELQKLSGIGAKKEKAILASAKTAGAKPAKTPSKPKSSSGKGKPTKSKPSKPSKPSTSKSKPKPEAKKDKPATKKPEPKAEAKNDDKKTTERPKAESSTQRPRPQSNYRPRDRKKKSSNPIVFVGKLVFKIAKKLLS